MNPLERTYLLLAMALMGLYFFPYCWLGENAYLTIHDNLDSDFLYLHILKLSNLAFAQDPTVLVPNMMNGIPRAALRSGLNLEVLIFWLLPSYNAYVVNFVLIHLTGFWGMYLLLRQYVLPEASWLPIRTAIALCFALVPGYIVHGISVSGQPLLLVAFLNLLHNRARWTDWLFIAFFPFYSFLVWSGLFIVAALALIGLFFMVQKRQFNGYYISGLTLLTLLYGLSEWQMIYSFVAKLYVSHRTEYDYRRILPITLVHSWGKSVQLFVNTQYHSGEYATRWIRGTLALAACVAFWQRDFAMLRRLFWLLLVAVVVCLVSGFYRYPAVWLGPGNLLQAFQFDRFYFLLPLLWLYAFAVALRALRSNRWVVAVLMLGQLVVMVEANQEFRVNVDKLFGQHVERDYIAYRSFYAPSLFSQVRDYIGKPQSSYRVACIGMHPAVALYNGFYTVDSYQNNYLLAYKHAFRQVIAAELDKAPKLKRYYDAYACRCYTYSAELAMTVNASLCGQHEHRFIRKLALNTTALRHLGGQYVVSAVPILNAAETGLSLERIFTEPTAYWKLFLYKVAR